MLAGIAVLASRIAAGQPVNAPSGLALSGYDVVAYFTLGKPVHGDRQFALPFQGVTYLFASTEDRAQFLADPSRYLPAYGGYAAYAVASGRLVPGDPKVFAIVEGRLYFNSSLEVHRRWLSQAPLYIGRADEKWPQLR
jgi:YHS domain-containing protein